MRILQELNYFAFIIRGWHEIWHFAHTGEENQMTALKLFNGKSCGKFHKVEI